MAILQNKFSRANLVKEQKSEFSEMYDKCLSAENFEYIPEKSKNTYKLLTDLLVIEGNDFSKILVPKTLIGPLLSNTHLLGHQGIKKMNRNLKSYSFENKYTIIKNFSLLLIMFLKSWIFTKIKIRKLPYP